MVMVTIMTMMVVIMVAIIMMMMMVAASPGSVGCAARQDGQDGMSWVCNKPVKIETQELELILLKS